MRHVGVLARTIGPRGSTTPAEREAAAYAERVFREAGLEPRVEGFRSVKSGWRPFAVAALFASLATLVFAFAGAAPWLAGALGILLLAVTASVLLEMYFRPNLLRPFVPKGTSQNVWAPIAPRGPAARRVVVVAHLDTHRTPWVFTRPWRLKFFKTMTTLGVAAFVIAAVAFIAYSLTGADWLRWLALALLPVHVAVLALTLQPDTTPYTEGANDNASGVGVLLSLAERLAREPLERTEVWAVASGCEEVGSVGAQAFVSRHRSELRGSLAVSIDNVGGHGAGVCYTSVEGMVLPLKPSPELFSLAEELRLARPELTAYSLPYTTLHTDATCFMANGVPSLSFVGLTREGVLPDWHQVTDVLENVSEETVTKTEEFVWHLLRRLDARAGS